MAFGESDAARSINSAAVKRRLLWTYSDPAPAKIEALAVFQQEDQRGVVLDVDLSVVAGGCQLAIPFEQQCGELGSGLDGGAQGWRGQLPESGKHRVDVQNIELGEQAAEELAEGFAHRAAIAVGLFHQVGHLFPEGQPVERGAQFRDRRRHQGQIADRLLCRCAAHFQFARMVFGIEDPDVVDFREIVILGRYPENGNGGRAVRGEPFGEFDGVKDLVNGITGAGEQTHLLAGNHGHRPGFGQTRERGTLGILHS